jgi:hypothetical protein
MRKPERKTQSVRGRAGSPDVPERTIRAGQGTMTATHASIMRHLDQARIRAGSISIGELCVGGDWACANGDLEALGEVARQLSECTLEPLRGEVLAVVDLCCRDPEHAIAEWRRLKDELFETPKRSSRS